MASEHHQSNTAAEAGFINGNVLNVIRALSSRSVRNVPSSFDFMELASVDLGVWQGGGGVRMCSGWTISWVWT